MEDILSSDECLKIYVETIGIKAIRAAGFHKTKCKVKYEKEVGIYKGGVEKLTALRSIKLKQNNFYSFKELKDLIKCVYDKLNVICAAKATDVQSVYSVKSTSRNGVPLAPATRIREGVVLEVIASLVKTGVYRDWETDRKSVV